MEIRDADFVKWVAQMRTSATKHNKDKYYRFHKDHDHDTKEPRQLKYEIENLIERGYLKQILKIPQKKQ